MARAMNLTDVSPPLTDDNFSDSRSVHLEFLADKSMRFARARQGSYFFDIYTPQNGVAIVFAVMIVAAFFRLIVRVVSISSKEQMVGMHARRIVASVKNGQTIGNCSTMQHPRNSMRQRHSFGIGNSAIPGRESGCGPSPARAEFSAMFGDRTSLIDFYPKSFGKSGSTAESARHLIRLRWVMDFSMAGVR
jgi:hypothetical protein